MAYRQSYFPNAYKETENIKFIWKACLIRNNYVGKWRRKRKKYFNGIVADLPTNSTTMITVF
jgi:hypothetical protein